MPAIADAIMLSSRAVAPTKILSETGVLLKAGGTVLKRFPARSDRPRFAIAAVAVLRYRDV
jgi:hypothetical protein